MEKFVVNKRNLFGLIIALTTVFILPFYYVQTYEKSVFTEGFPIPGNAKVVKISGEHKFESYKWYGASEEDGLPLRYKIIIHLAGWKQVETFGAMTTYEKDRVKIEVITTSKLIDLYSEK